MSMNLDLGNSIQCPNCQTPYPVQVEQIIDVGLDPSAKSRFLSGQSTTSMCPKCGYRVALATPVLYHDPEKELFLTFVPMELGMQQQERERIIGQLIKAAMDAIPPEQRKGYLFQPKEMLSMQGMMETILEADGVTPEMLAAQREKMRLVETFLQTDEDALPALIEQYNEQIDIEFLDIVMLAAQNAQASGRPDVAGAVMAVREKLLALSTVGQQVAEEEAAQQAAIEEVTSALQSLGQEATLDDFMDLVLAVAGDDYKLQALVGLQFPSFDYHFFQRLSEHIEQSEGLEKQRLSALRDRLNEMTNTIREQQEAMAQAAVQTLQDILSSEDLDEAIQRNLPRIDEAFMMVLSANIQAAEERNDLMASAQLKKISETLTAMVQQAAPPELQFVSGLLQAETHEEMVAFAEAEAGKYGPDLLVIIDALMQDLESREDNGLMERLKAARDAVAGVVA